jgi:phosphoribosylanthranilate isomerase
LVREIPAGKRVAVTVRPARAEVLGLLAEGFDAVQVHLDPAEGDEPASLAEAAPGKLWLAPRLAGTTPFPAAWLPMASTWVVDTHQAGSFGGTGKTGDWDRAAELRDRHPEKAWFLAGGLGPETVVGAARAGFRHLDLNSKVELAPGLKSAEKLHAAAEVLRKFAQS